MASFVDSNNVLAYILYAIDRLHLCAVLLVGSSVHVRTWYSGLGIQVNICASIVRIRMR